jgi:hypothetical protein
MRTSGEPAHVQPDLGDDDVRGRPPDPGDLIEAFHRRGERGDQLLDLDFHRGDVSVGFVTTDLNTRVTRFG